MLYPCPPDSPDTVEGGGCFGCGAVSCVVERLHLDVITRACVTTYVTTYQAEASKMRNYVILYQPLGAKGFYSMIVPAADAATALVDVVDQGVVPLAISTNRTAFRDVVPYMPVKFVETNEFWGLGS